MSQASEIARNAQRDRDQSRIGATPRNDASISKRLKLRCGVCGRTGRYDVGRVFISPEAQLSREDGNADESIAFTRYFRCRACDAGGPWHLGFDGLTRLIVALMRMQHGSEDTGVYLGELRTFDNHRFRYATEAEAHLQELISREPDRAFLWTRLGNVYRHGDREDLAEETYRRALDLDPGDFEANSSIAEIMDETDRAEEATEHWKAVLLNARSATEVPREVRLDAVSSALEALLCAAEDPNDVFGLLPMVDAATRANRPPGEPVILDLHTFDLSDPDDWEDVCVLFLGEKGFRPRRRHHSETLRDTSHHSDVCSTTISRAEPAVGRNAQCPCGSGLKYKKCCGRS